jgi:ribokinase
MHRRAEARTVIVIGNCTLDVAFHLARFPLPGETLLTDRQVRDVGGKGANQAVAAARAGTEVVFCSSLGSDDDGRMMRDHLRDEGVDVSHVRRFDGPSDVSIIYVVAGGENSIVSTHAAARSLQATDVDVVLEGATVGNVVLMQGNLQRDLTAYALERAQAGGLRTILNPAPIHYPYDALWPFVDYAVLNEVEIESLTGDRDTGAGAQRLLELGVRDVIATLGPAGAAWISHEGVERFGAEAVDAIDTTGAGDVFCGVLAASIALAQPLDRAIGSGVRAATLSVTRPGTQAAFPSREELRGLMEGLAERR